MRPRDNPLRADCVNAVRFRLEAIAPDLTWPALLARLEAMQWRGALLGPEGSGKTTLLEQLELHLAPRGWKVRHLRLSTENPRFPRDFWTRFCPSSDEILLFDGAEQLSRLAWRRFERQSRGAAGLVITTHRDGLLPVLAQCRTSPLLLRDILGELLGGDAARWHDEVDSLWQRHHGNVRHALRELYDVYAMEEQRE